MGAEPEINFYAQRESVTGYIYTYPFFENHPLAKSMSDQWIDEVRENPPEYIVLMGHWITYINKENEMFKKIWRFSKTFIKEHDYKKIGIVDIPIDDGSVRWGSLAGEESIADNFIYVYRRTRFKK